MDEVLDRLRGAYRFESRIAQIDDVYAYRLDDLMNPSAGTVIARIRHTGEGDGGSLTVKRRRLSDLDRDEYETNVSDPVATNKILVTLGMELFVNVSKVRNTFTSHREQAHILVDKVEGLAGTYIEIEVLDDETNKEGVAERILDDVMKDVKSRVGGRLETVDKGYDRLLVELTSNK